MRFGAFDLHIVPDGLFRLDRGAMFGVVPKVLWKKTVPADEKNRIRNVPWGVIVEDAPGECPVEPVPLDAPVFAPAALARG